MQRVSSQNCISISTRSPVDEARTTSSTSNGGFFDSIRRVSNAVSNRFTVHAAPPSSPWKYDRQGSSSHPALSSFSTAPKGGGSRTLESIVNGYHNKTAKYAGNPSAYDGIEYKVSHDIRQQSYNKISHPQNKK